MNARRIVLITGATGFLGGATAARLLEQQLAGTQLLFLVRATTPAEGLQRMQVSLARFEVAQQLLDTLDARNILCGDLANVAAFADDSRLDEVTEVINCAAIASFSNHPGIWPINVVGTFAFATRMAAVKGLKRFVHVGTAMACGPNMQSPVSESWDLPADDEHLVPYTASKAEIERKLRIELPTLPLVVARPSIVVGHSKYGCAPSASIFWVFRMAHALEKFTCELTEQVDVVPVDYCAEALIKLALSEKLKWSLYHISAGSLDSNTFGEIDMAYAEAKGIEPIGPRYQVIALEEIGGLLQEFKARLGDCNKRLVARALRLYGGFAELNYVFDNSRLLHEGLHTPPRFTSYMGACVASSSNVPIAEQMLEDFK